MSVWYSQAVVTTFSDADGRETDLAIITGEDEDSPTPGVTNSTGLFVYQLSPGGDAATVLFTPLFLEIRQPEMEGSSVHAETAYAAPPPVIISSRPLWAAK
jgi:hypothetical protein